MCADGQLVGLAGMLGVLAHGGGQFLHRGGGFFQVGGLLLGAARQVTVAGGDFARGQVDAACGGLDLADDLGQLRDGGIGVVAHGGEHALEIAVHACGQVAFGDGRQQLGEFAQVLVADLHHRVEVGDHQAEIVIEAGGVAALAEVASRGGRCQALDFAVDVAQVLLDRIDGSGDLRLLAGVAGEIRAQVTLSVTLHDGQHLAHGLHVCADQGVGLMHHQTVLAREGALIHAVAGVAGVVMGRHLALSADHRVQLFLHAGHAFQQAARLVMGLLADATVQLAAGDALGHVGRLAQGQGDAVADQPAQGEHDQHHATAGGGHDAGEHQCLLLHVFHVHAAADHPLPRLVHACVGGLHEQPLFAGLFPLVGDHAAADAGHADQVVEQADTIFRTEVLHVLADQVLAERMHDHAVLAVVNAVVERVVVRTHAPQGFQRALLGLLLAQLAALGQAVVVVQDAVGQLDLDLEAVLAGVGQVQVLHARSDHRQRNHAEGDQQRQHVQLAPDGEVGEVLVPAAE